jgi:hypothetical protein
VLMMRWYGLYGGMLGVDSRAAWIERSMSYRLDIRNERGFTMVGYVVWRIQCIL